VQWNYSVLMGCVSSHSICKYIRFCSHTILAHYFYFPTYVMIYIVGFRSMSEVANVGLSMCEEVKRQPRIRHLCQYLLLL
jgi:hypothetical protein